MAGISVFTAFQQQMKTMCLNDFPCGIGSWNRSKYSAKRAKDLKLLKYHGENEKEQDKDVNEEELEALEEYLTCEQSPWKTKDLSPETQHLRDLAITSPSLVKEHFLCSHLQSLRLVGKQICEVDEDLLKFQNLEELTLSANGITTLNSTNLPRKLKVLELCSNEISSLKDLCFNPPPQLQHLGLSYNKLSLTSEYRYLSAEFWPNLISLDLSFNDFVNLRGIVAHLSLLPKLKNLILLGNPLALLPNYRGFIIDALRTLSSLDDVFISPAERHHFKDFSKYNVPAVDGTQVTIDIGNVTGIPNPIDPLEELPEFPIVKSNYFVTYEFLEDPKSSKMSIKSPKEDNTVVTQREAPSSAMLSKNRTPSPQATSVVVLDSAADTPLCENEQICCVITYKTPRKPWADPIICNYTKEYQVKELYALKKLLQVGLTVTVVEEQILSWPIETEDDNIPEAFMKDQDFAKGGKHSAKDKKKKDSAKAKKGKDSAKAKKGKDSAKAKKKLSVALRSDPPIKKILGNCHVDLYSIVKGDHFFEMVCDLGVPKTEPRVESPISEVKESKKGKNAKKKDENSKGTAASLKNKPKDKWDHKKRKGKENIDSGASEEAVPKHLFVEFKLQKFRNLVNIMDLLLSDEPLLMGDLEFPPGYRRFYVVSTTTAQGGKPSPLSPSITGEDT